MCHIYIYIYISDKAPEPKRSTLASDSANSLWQAYKSNISPFPATGKGVCVS